jgi:uncharacterized protein (DUF2141 family)
VTSITTLILWLALRVTLPSGVDANVSIAGAIRGASGRYPVFVALWDDASFLRRPVQSVRLSAGAPLEYSFSVAAGRWAVSAFEDRNGNGTLDMGVFGPKEPSGFWRPFHRWRKPEFTDVAVAVDADVLHADIDLR